MKGMERKVIMNQQDIERCLERMALEIIESNRGVEDLAIVGIHTGGVYLAEQIHKLIMTRENVDVRMGNLDITLYRDDWSLIGQNPVVRQTDIDFSVEGKRVILVDDVLFTGRTIRAAMDALMDFGRPGLIQLAVLVDRGGRELPIQPDFVGIKVDVAPEERVDVLFSDSGVCTEVVVSSDA